jgi:hypothetical protein
MTADSRVNRRMSMRYASMVVMLACAITPSLSKETAEGPTVEKAQKTCKEASEYLHRRMTDAALDSFKKADKQNGGHCLPCQKKMITYGMELRDWKTSQRLHQTHCALSFSRPLIKIRNSTSAPSLRGC